jgi:putative NADH-flavin reductase
MQITVFGASGKVGRLVVQRLLHDGHRVVLFVHQTSPFEASDNIKIIKGDIHNAALVASAVSGSQAVVSALGSWHTPTKDILSAAMRFVIPAMQQQGVRRIITLTGSGAWAPGDSISVGNKVAHSVFNVFAKDIVRDAETHLRLLDDSGLDWTSIRSPIMKNGPSETYRLSKNVPGAVALINREAVAKAMTDQLNDTAWIAKAPHIHAL